MGKVSNIFWVDTIHSGCKYYWALGRVQNLPSTMFLSRHEVRLPVCPPTLSFIDTNKQIVPSMLKKDVSPCCLLGHLRVGVTKSLDITQDKLNIISPAVGLSSNYLLKSKNNFSLIKWKKNKKTGANMVEVAGGTNTARRTTQWDYCVDWSSWKGKNKDGAAHQTERGTRRRASNQTPASRQKVHNVHREDISFHLICVLVLWVFRRGAKERALVPRATLSSQRPLGWQAAGSNGWLMGWGGLLWTQGSSRRERRRRRRMPFISIHHIFAGWRCLSATSVERKTPESATG